VLIDALRLRGQRVEGLLKGYPGLDQIVEYAGEGSLPRELVGMHGIALKRRANPRWVQNKAGSRQKVVAGQPFNHKDRSSRGEFWRIFFGLGYRDERLYQDLTCYVQMQRSGRHVYRIFAQHHKYSPAIGCRCVIICCKTRRRSANTYGSCEGPASAVHATEVKLFALVVR